MRSFRKTDCLLIRGFVEILSSRGNFNDKAVLYYIYSSQNFTEILGPRAGSWCLCTQAWRPALGPPSACVHTLPAFNLITVVGKGYRNKIFDF